MRSSIAMAFILFLSPIGSVAGGLVSDDSFDGDAILQEFSPGVSAAFERALSDHDSYEGHNGSWILLSQEDADFLIDVLPSGHLDAVDWMDGTYVWTPYKSAKSLEVLERLEDLDFIELFIPDKQHQKTPRLIPNDPDFPDQWHLSNTGQTGGLQGEDVNITGVWNSYNGSGVTISIIDDGLDHSHPDLSPNYEASTSYDFCDSDSDPTPSGNDAHGTAAGGVAAATGNNGVDVTGAGFGANLAGSRLIACWGGDSLDASALGYMPQDIDIYSNSWGPSDNGATISGPGPLTLSAIENGAYNGRGGLGNIYTFAAGNGLQNDDDSNADGFTNNRFTIAVTAVDHNGVQSWYAEPGANILVAAPSDGDGEGITTTDVAGSSGYNEGDVTDSFGGTSSATPLVSGVISLMLEANGNLSWRDVQEIIVLTSKKNHISDVSWASNGAGHLVSHKYGFGVIDAGAATSMALNWSNLVPESNSTYGPTTTSLSISEESGWVESQFIVTDNMSIESVSIMVDISHSNRGDLDIELMSPSGTISVLRGSNNDTGDDIQDWVYGSVHHWGESSAGNWTLRLKDSSPGTTGTLNSWSLTLHGVDLESDHDDDGLLTVDEINLHGTDPYDSDTDDDGLDDAFEVGGGTNPLVSDSDIDGLIDGDEVEIFLTDPLNSDTDGDGLLDGQEIAIYGSDPLIFDPDSDGDLYYHFDDCDDSDPGVNPGRPDILNGIDDDCDQMIDEGYNFTDRDGDGLKDWPEFHIHSTDYLDHDTDDDGLSDGDEVLIYFTDPLIADEDSDADGRYWFEDCDDSNPLISPDALEYLDGIDNDCDNEVDEDYLDTDSDSDGLSDYEEFNLRFTNPFHPDSDGDGLSDGHEISTSLTDPLVFDKDEDADGFYWFEDCDDQDANSSPVGVEILDKKDNDCDGFSDEDFIDLDSDVDGLSDYDEVHIHDTQPLDYDTDGDLMSDGDEVLLFETDPKSFDSDEDMDGFYWFDDCDDLDPEIRPDANELWDGLDQNCNTLVDEGINRFSELGHTIGAAIVWEASNDSMVITAPSIPEGVNATMYWSLDGIPLNQYETGDLSSIEIGPLRCAEEDILRSLCESPEPHMLELRLVDSGIQTILVWSLDIRTWSEPPTLSEQLLDVISGPLGFAIIGCIILILAITVAVTGMVSRRRAVLKEALEAYGFSEQHIHEASAPQNIPRAPDFNRD
ncbi:MAG: S8 family serine peptidase [Candidatus Thalassarchaeaceae archaeon]